MHNAVGVWNKVIIRYRVCTFEQREKDFEMMRLFLSGSINNYAYAYSTYYCAPSSPPHIPSETLLLHKCRKTERTPRFWGKADTTGTDMSNRRCGGL